MPPGRAYPSFWGGKQAGGGHKAAAARPSQPRTFAPPLLSKAATEESAGRVVVAARHAVTHPAKRVGPFFRWPPAQLVRSLFAVAQGGQSRPPGFGARRPPFLTRRVFYPPKMRRGWPLAAWGWDGSCFPEPALCRRGGAVSACFAFANCCGACRTLFKWMPAEECLGHQSV
ncbi:unnamed protein product [Amoebophrya sp. A120]|nr:unnamed protein product [Amoebophrya sp. A120]|eukprot:GSA120T00000639001.1